MPFLDIPYKYNHMIHGLLYLTSPLRMTSLRVIHVVAYISISLLFIVKNYSIIWIDHILFFHSPANGHLDCFHIWYPLDSNTEFDPKTTITNPIPRGATTCWNQHKGQPQSPSFPSHPHKGKNAYSNWSYTSDHLIVSYGHSLRNMILFSSSNVSEIICNYPS